MFFWSMQVRAVLTAANFRTFHYLQNKPCALGLSPFSPSPTHREPPGVPSGEHARLPRQVPRVPWVTLSKPRVLALSLVKAGAAETPF